MKKGVLLIIISFVFFAGYSQSENNATQMFKAGISGGMVIPEKNATAAAGIDLAYEKRIRDFLGIGFITGFHHYFVHNTEVNRVTVKNTSFNIVPAAALIRLYPNSKGIYLGTDVGYGFIFGNDKVATNRKIELPGGGVYFKFLTGYRLKHIEIFAQYSKTFTGGDGDITISSETQKFDTGIIGAGVTYTIKYW